VNEVIRLILSKIYENNTGTHKILKKEKIIGVVGAEILKSKIIF